MGVAPIILFMNQNFDDNDHPRNPNDGRFVAKPRSKVTDRHLSFTQWGVGDVRAAATDLADLLNSSTAPVGVIEHFGGRPVGDGMWEFTGEPLSVVEVDDGVYRIHPTPPNVGDGADPVLKTVIADGGKVWELWTVPGLGDRVFDSADTANSYLSVWDAASRQDYGMMVECLPRMPYATMDMFRVAGSKYVPLRPGEYEWQLPDSCGANVFRLAKWRDMDGEHHYETTVVWRDGREQVCLDTGESFINYSGLDQV